MHGPRCITGDEDDVVFMDTAEPVFPYPLPVIDPAGTKDLHGLFRRIAGQM